MATSLIAVLNAGQEGISKNEQVHSIVPSARIPLNVKTIRLNGSVLTPGFVALQVNGGGGVSWAGS